MRKCFVAVLILALLTAGTVQAASFSSNAVRSFVSKTLTKACGTVANDNRCLRLVSGGSSVLETAAVGAMYFARPSWVSLVATVLLPVVGEYAFQLGQKIRATLTKTNNQVIVTEVEKTAPASDIPEVISAEIGGSPVMGNQWTTIDMPIANDIFGNSLDDPRATLVSKGYFRSPSSADIRFSNIKDYQKYLSLSSPKSISVYESLSYDSSGYLNPVQKTVDYWYFTSGSFVPYWLQDGYTGNRKFVGYFSPIQYVISSVKYSGWVLIMYNHGGEACGSGYIYEGGCFALSDRFPQNADYFSNSDVNFQIRQEQSKPTVTYPNVPFEDWLDTLTEEEKQSVVSSDLMSDFVNAVWEQAASQPGYEGIPYQPGIITAGNMQEVPSIGDLVEKISPTIGVGGLDEGIKLSPTNPTTNPGDLPSTDPADNITGIDNPSLGFQGHVGEQDINISLDLGTHPNIEQPSLAEPPTAPMILQPIFDLFPFLQNYQVPDHSSECPRPSFEAFGEQYTVEFHCELLEDNRQDISSIFLVLWTIFALCVLLKA